MGRVGPGTERAGRARLTSSEARTHLSGRRIAGRTWTPGPPASRAAPEPPCRRRPAGTSAAAGRAGWVPASTGRRAARAAAGRAEAPAAAAPAPRASRADRRRRESRAAAARRPAATRCRRSASRPWRRGASRSDTGARSAERAARLSGHPPLIEYKRDKLPAASQLQPSIATI